MKFKKKNFKKTFDENDDDESEEREIESLQKRIVIQTPLSGSQIPRFIH